MAEIQLREVLKEFDKAYFTKKTSKNDFDLFCEKAKEYAWKVNKAIEGNKVEENFKLDFRSLLIESFYAKRKDCAIEPVNPIDMAIVKDDVVRVLMEFKRFSNKAEMVRKDDLNRKALHESLAYFFDQFYNKNNRQIRSIVISNGEDFFIFDSKEFTQKPLEKIGKATASEDLVDNKTDFIYSYFKDVIKNENITFKYTYFNCNDLIKGSTGKKIAIYKTLHPDYLLREYSHRDSNQLNNDFYIELLHILGLSETRKNGKILIQPSNNKQGLINETIEQLATDKGIYNQKEAFEIAFELVINWLNRILFLKLFESQLVSFNGGDSQYRFLTAEKVKSYDSLNNLFFKILGRPICDRVGDQLSRIPYLNSSLFEVSGSEVKYFCISSLDNDAQTEIFKSSSLKKWSEYKNVNKVSTLKYLLDFLESYDFSSVDDGDLLTKNSTEIINPSVLGLIFEKLNGYKEGSFFTPGYITEFMAQLSVEKAVIQKFNQTLNIKAESLAEISNYIGSPVHKTADLERYNQIVDSLKIVDPAVGSGHFLVSVLNYIIYLKSKLGILWDGKTRITEEIEIVDDALCVYIDDHLFSYKRNDPRTYRLQKALFKEKQKIIENCLFGVDINEKSVTICQLRLWIELLKNSYYKDKDSDEMELLPNIDINIKANNSLISKYKPAPGKSITKSGEIKKVQDVINAYKQSVCRYKHSGDKKEKSAIKINIAKIKSHLYQWVQQDLFSDVLKDNHEFIYKKAMEWLIEFPELLDENGKFQGFDLVIGNPPYIKEPGNKAIFEPLKFDPLYQGKMDLWYFFASRGMDILKRDGLLCFIAPNNWITNFGAKKLRNDLLERAEFLDYIDFGNYMVFESASIQTMIFLLRKRSVKQLNFPYTLVTKESICQQQVAEYLRNYHVSKESDLFRTNDQVLNVVDLVNCTFSFVANNSFAKILKKIEGKANFKLTASDVTNGIHPHHGSVTRKMLDILGSDYDIGEGIFVLSETEVQELKLDDKERLLLKPFYETENIHRFYVDKDTNLQIIYTDSKFNNPLEMDQYPKLKRHLDRYAKVITSDNRPYGLHRARQQHFFEGEKILSLRKCETPTFSFCDFDCYVGAKYYVLQPQGVNLKFLTGLLNSKLIAFWLKHKGKIQGNNYQVDKEPLLNIAIRTDDGASEKIAELVGSIISTKIVNSTTDVSRQESDIDKIVYDLYEMDADEVKIIEADLANSIATP